MFETTALPAQRLSDEQFNALPALTDPQVGDTIAIYSRGSIRVALIEKVGRTNVTAVYTTEGAITSAQKIVDFGRSTPEALRSGADRSEARAAEYEALAEGIADDEKIQTGTYTSNTAKNVRINARKERELAVTYRERANLLESLPAERKYEVFLNVTRKSVKVADAALIERAA